MVRTFAASAALTCLLSLGACGKGAPDAPATPAEVTVPDETASTSTAETPDDAAAPASENATPAGRPTRAPQTPAAMQQRSERGFDRLDVNGDDVVTTAELDAAAESGGRSGRMLSRADANGDGRITRAEVRAMAAERFDRMDTNGDGTISDDERPNRDGRGMGEGPN